MPSPFLTAEWRKLIMAQYEVAPATLLPYLPPGIELDLSPATRPPRCFVSLVGFLFERVRVLALPVPLHTRFPEVNLRFYVSRTTPDGTRRRGVVFISEIVPRRAISARRPHPLRGALRHRPMRHTITASPRPRSTSPTSSATTSSGKPSPSRPPPPPAHPRRLRRRLHHRALLRLHPPHPRPLPNTRTPAPPSTASSTPAGPPTPSSATPSASTSPPSTAPPSPTSPPAPPTTSSSPKAPPSPSSSGQRLPT